MSDTATRILIVEDEPGLCEAIVSFLALDGHEARGVGSTAEADAWLRNEGDADIVILDIGLPDGDGVSWIQQRPSLHGKGLILVTARGELTDRLRGLTVGADAYLVKPVELAELRLVVRNVAQRVAPVAAEPHWQLDPVAWTLARGGKTLKLTRSESVLLAAVASTPGSVVPRDLLIRALGHDPALYDLRRMEIMVRRLRQKVRSAIGSELPVTTAHGVGYAFTAAINVTQGG